MYRVQIKIFACVRICDNYTGRIFYLGPVQLNFVHYEGLQKPVNISEKLDRILMWNCSYGGGFNYQLIGSATQGQTHLPNWTLPTGSSVVRRYVVCYL